MPPVTPSYDSCYNRSKDLLVNVFSTKVLGGELGTAYFYAGSASRWGPLPTNEATLETSIVSRVAWVSCTIPYAMHPDRVSASNAATATTLSIQWQSHKLYTVVLIIDYCISLWAMAASIGSYSQITRHIKDQVAREVHSLRYCSTISQTANCFFVLLPLELQSLHFDLKQQPDFTSVYINY
ncbi:hypothetical protein BU15DRAFT_62929 [Melanogaster broomeanus]|nr:hypothetical protein BU15DRAFT_62929 [Melanogaster broomeanus]